MNCASEAARNDLGCPVFVFFFVCVYLCFCVCVCICAHVYNIALQETLARQVGLILHLSWRPARQAFSKGVNQPTVMMYVAPSFTIFLIILYYVKPTFVLHFLGAWKLLQA